MNEKTKKYFNILKSHMQSLDAFGETKEYYKSSPFLAGYHLAVTQMIETIEMLENMNE